MSFYSKAPTQPHAGERQLVLVVSAVVPGDAVLEGLEGDA